MPPTEFERHGQLMSEGEHRENVHQSARERSPISSGKGSDSVPAFLGLVGLCAFGDNLEHVVGQRALQLERLLGRRGAGSVAALKLAPSELRHETGERDWR